MVGRMRASVCGGGSSASNSANNTKLLLQALLTYVPNIIQRDHVYVITVGRYDATYILFLVCMHVEKLKKN